MSAMMQILQPPGWARPKGYANGIVAKGRLVFISGQVGWTPQGEWQAHDFAGQFRQAIANILEVLAQAGGEMVTTLQEHVKKAIAPYKYPRSIEFVDTLPRTETGKLQRFKLKPVEK